MCNTGQKGAFTLFFLFCLAMDTVDIALLLPLRRKWRLPLLDSSSHSSNTSLRDKKICEALPLTLSPIGLQSSSGSVVPPYLRPFSLEMKACRLYVRAYVRHCTQIQWWKSTLILRVFCNGHLWLLFFFTTMVCSLCKVQKTVLRTHNVISSHFDLSWIMLPDYGLAWYPCWLYASSDITTTFPHFFFS